MLNTSLLWYAGVRMLSGRGAGDNCFVDNRLLKAPLTIVENFPLSLAFSGEKETAGRPLT